MNNYIWKVKFKIDHLLTDHPIKDEFIEFFSPHFPSTEKDKDYTEGQLTISLSSLNYSVKEIVTEGLRTVIALTNQINLPVEIIKIESPPGVSPGIKIQLSGYQSFPIKESEKIPYFWNKYQKLIENSHQELNYSIQWFMRAVKSDNPIDKFVYSWITFNMLYGWLTQVKGEQHHEGIKALTGKDIPCLNKQKEIVIRHKTILEELSRLNLTDRGGIDRAKKLRMALYGRSPRKILECAIGAFGVIRHNIFHGSLKDRTMEAGRCIWPLIDLDAEIIKDQLDKI